MHRKKFATNYYDIILILEYLLSKCLENRVVWFMVLKLLILTYLTETVPLSSVQSRLIMLPFYIKNINTLPILPQIMFLLPNQGIRTKKLKYFQSAISCSD